MRLPTPFPPRCSLLRSFAAATIAACLPALGFPAPVHAQTRPAYWISSTTESSPPTVRTFADVVRAAIGAAYDVRRPDVRPGASAAETVERALRSLSADDLVFAGVDWATLADLLRRDPGLVSRLGLEPLNLAAGAAPFYLFAQASAAASLRQPSTEPRRILYVDKIGGLQPAYVADLLSPLLRSRIEVAAPLDSPRVLADRLLAGTVDIVGVHDNEPSAFRRDFIDFYEQRRPRGDDGALLKLIVIPTSDAAYRDRPLGLAVSDVTYAIVSYADAAFYDPPPLAPANPDDRIVAVSTSGPGSAATEGPGALLILTNLGRLGTDPEHQQARRLIGHAHLAALFQADLAPARCTADTRANYRSFLVNAYLSDKDNVVKGLAVWSDLVLAIAGARGREQGSRNRERAELEDQLTMVDDMLVGRQEFHVADKKDWAKLATTLSGSASLREQFSGQDASLFRLALEGLRTAFSLTGPQRRQALQSARVRIVELIRKGVDPACTVGGSEGLFNQREFDPFFYLGLIDAHLAIESES